MLLLILVLGSAGFFMIAVNAVIFWRTWIRKEENVPSCAPFLGGLLAALAIFLAAEGKYRLLCFIPMILDCGCIPAAVRFAYVCIRYNILKDWFDGLKK